MRLLPKRKDAVAMLERLLRTSKDDLVPERESDWQIHTVNGRLINMRNVPHHWGLVELRLFLDELYGGPPKDESEELKKKPC